MWVFSRMEELTSMKRALPSPLLWSGEERRCLQGRRELNARRDARKGNMCICPGPGTLPYFWITSDAVMESGLRVWCSVYQGLSLQSPSIFSPYSQDSLRMPSVKRKLTFHKLSSKDSRREEGNATDWEMSATPKGETWAKKPISDCLRWPRMTSGYL